MLTGFLDSNWANPTGRANYGRGSYHAALDRITIELATDELQQEVKIADEARKLNASASVAYAYCVRRGHHRYYRSTKWHGSKASQTRHCIDCDATFDVPEQEVRT